MCVCARAPFFHVQATVETCWLQKWQGSCQSAWVCGFTNVSCVCCRAMIHPFVRIAAAKRESEGGAARPKKKARQTQ